MNPDAALALAAYAGHVGTIRRALATGAHPDALLREDSALWWAAQEGHAEVVSILANAGANIDFADPAEGFTPLYQAATGGHLAATEILLRRGADVNRRYPAICGGTVLHTVAAWGRLGCIRLLLRHGADPNARDRDSQTPLDTATACGKDEAVDLLRRAAGEPSA